MKITVKKVFIVKVHAAKLRTQNLSMNNDKPPEADWIVRWVYTKEEWQHFERWNARNKGLLNYLWHFLFYKDKRVPNIEFNGQWIKISGKQRYFNGPVTELRRVDINDKGPINIMNITYENINNSHLSEISIPIPKGKLKEAIDAHERLMNNRTNL